MNARNKGRRTELFFKKQLEKEGYICELAKLSQKFQIHNDFFNLFDIIALKGKYKKFIQCKTNHLPSKQWIEAAKKFKQDFTNKFDSIEIWIKYDRKKAKKVIL